MSGDGQRLYVSSAKGLGSGRNAGPGFADPGRGLHPGDIMQGTLQIVETPRGTTLSDGTRQVVDNTYAAREVPPLLARTLPYANSRFAGPIKHIVFVVKENRTYDQVFGQRRDARGNPSGATLGLGVRVASKDGRRVLPRVDVTPNHHALADRFAISDNFYCDADQSNTGHRWVVGVYPNEWVEVNARSRIEARPFGPAPGRRNVNGSSAVVNPEDYNEAGALWEHLARHGVPFFNFGFGAEMPQSIEQQMHKETGIRMTVSFPLPKPLFDRSSRTYPTFNMAIPDQYRMDMFEEELRTRWESGVEPFPSLVTIVLPNDHMTTEHPEDGYPFRESYVADNDLALGRLVERLSHSRWWDDMLIIVTEDDPQGGTDSVDAHRSLLMFISPWVKRGYVSPVLAQLRIADALAVHAARPAAAQPVRRRRHAGRRHLHRYAGHHAVRRASVRPAPVRPATRVQAVRSSLQLAGARGLTGHGRSRRHAARPGRRLAVGGVDTRDEPGTSCPLQPEPPPALLDARRGVAHARPITTRAETGRGGTVAVTAVVHDNSVSRCSRNPLNVLTSACRSADGHTALVARASCRL